MGVWRAPRVNKKPGRITDVWSKGNYAYLGTFAPPCSGLGVHVVDISNPAAPERAGFIPARPGTRVNDVKVFHFSELASGFSGDVLLHSNEVCGTSSKAIGGVSLYDVTDPTSPQFLSNAGDFTNPDGTPRSRARQVHNSYAWQDGDRAYAVFVDDEELKDVDIFDITDPRNPVQIAETGLPDWPSANVDGFGSDAFLHDVWAKKIGDSWRLLLSYWDAGWVQLDVSNPSSPVFLGDSDYPFPDPLIHDRLGLDLTSEGNAHAGVWDTTGDLLVTGDEDFSAYRLEFSVPSGEPGAGTWPSGEFSWTKPIASLPDHTVNGPTVFGGYGCSDDLDDIPSATSVFPSVDPGEDRVIVFQRGPVDDPNHPHDACFFSDKVAADEAKGYDAVIVANHHIGAQAGAQPDAFICGSQGSAVAGTAAGLCIGHRFMHEAFGTTPDYTVPYPSDGSEPAIGALGPHIEVTSQFDGWGPLHLIDANTLEQYDEEAPAEAYDESFASGFGDLTMHNVETDPDTNLAYISWYSLGLRVYRFSADDGLEEVGHYIDQKGNNFWGVHLATDHPTDPHLILASDRDSGLWMFHYTG